MMNPSKILENLLIFGAVMFVLWFAYSFSRSIAKGESIKNFSKLSLLEKIKAYINALYLTGIGIVILTGAETWYDHSLDYNFVVEASVVILISSIIGASKGFKDGENNDRLAGGE